MTGNVFHYTAKGTIASYEKMNDGYETLVREVLSGLNDTIDYTDYNSDGDGLYRRSLPFCSKRRQC